MHSVLGYVSTRTGFEILDCLTLDTLRTINFFHRADLECRATFAKLLVPCVVQQSEVKGNGREGGGGLR